MVVDDIPRGRGRAALAGSARDLGALDQPPLLALRQRQAGRPMAHSQRATNFRLGERTVGDEQVALDRCGRRRHAPRRTDLAPGLREGPSKRLRASRLKRATHGSILARPIAADRSRRFWHERDSAEPRPGSGGIEHLARSTRLNPIDRRLPAPARRSPGTWPGLATRRGRSSGRSRPRWRGSHRC